MDDDEILTVDEAAVRYKLSRTTIYNACNKGRLVFIRFGEEHGAIRIRASDLRDYENRCTHHLFAKALKKRPAMGLTPEQQKAAKRFGLL